MKLSSKISLAFLPGILLALAVIYFLVYPSLESSLNQSIGAKHLITLQHFMGHIDHLFYERYNHIQVVARESLFVEHLRGKRSARDARLQRKLSDLLAMTGPWDILTIVNKEGVITFSNDQRLINRRFTAVSPEAAVLRRSLEGSVFSSDLVFSPETGQPTVLFAAPIIGYDAPARPLLGAVLGYFSWPVIQELLEESPDFSERRLYNKDGLLIGTSRPQERADILRRNDKLRPELTRALAGESSTLLTQRPGGGRDLTAYVPQQGYLGYRGNGWVLTAQTPTEVAFAPIRRFMRNAIVIFSLFIGLSFLIAIAIVIGTVSKPLRRLSEATRWISKGQYGHTIDVSSNDEIGELTRNFNRMSESLAASNESKDYLNSLILGLADVLIVTSPGGVILTVNHAALQLLGYTEDELFSQPASKIFDAEQIDNEPAFLKTLTFAGTIKDMEMDLITKNGQKISVLLSGSVLKNKEDKIEGLALVAKDLTERKKFEQMLAQSEKLSAVGQLAAGVAHEINNPLGIILGFAQSAAKRIKEGEVLWLPVKSIEREALRCKNLVQNLLTFSRQSKGKIEEADLDEAVCATMSIIEAQARVKSVEVALELGAPGTFLGDKNQIQQVLINLCNNAIDAMPDGGRITVRTKKAAAENGPLCLMEVQDNGSGIPDEIKGKIFNPFFTTKEVGKGTGLGLSLVYEIIQRHKGNIEVDSAVGKGTKFTVSLPAKSG